MKNYLLQLFYISGILLLGFGNTVNAQEIIPEFEFQLYFEDAAGNRDTLILGYDENATDSIDHDFGEVDIKNQPWGEGLDVRIGNLIYHNEEWGVNNGELLDYIFSTETSENIYLTKKKIVDHVCNVGYHNASRRISIQLTTQNYPVTIKWDKTPFNSTTCLYYSMFYGVSDHMQEDVGGNYQLAYFDSIQVFENNTINNAEVIWDYLDTNSSQSIKVIQFNFVNAGSVSISESVLSETPIIYPNPITENDVLNMNINGKYQIVNEVGQIIQEGKDNEGGIPLKLKNSGIYYLNIITLDNKIFNLKLIVK